MLVLSSDLIIWKFMFSLIQMGVNEDKRVIRRYILIKLVFTIADKLFRETFKH